MIRCFLLCLFVLLWWACETSELTPARYLHWLGKEDNGLSIKNGGQLFTYTLKYRPLEEIILHELGSTCSQSEVDSLRSAFNGSEYYLLKLESVDKSPDLIMSGLTSKGDYYERLNYLTFNFQSDIAIVINNDTSMCSMYHFERNYGTAPYVNILLAFPSLDTAFSYDREVLVFPRIEPEPQMMRFKIPKETILNIPKLKI